MQYKENDTQETKKCNTKNILKESLKKISKQQLTTNKQIKILIQNTYAVGTWSKE